MYSQETLESRERKVLIGLIEELARHEKPSEQWLTTLTIFDDLCEPAPWSAICIEAHKSCYQVVRTKTGYEHRLYRRGEYKKVAVGIPTTFLVYSTIRDRRMSSFSSLLKSRLLYLQAYNLPILARVALSLEEVAAAERMLHALNDVVNEWKEFEAWKKKQSFETLNKMPQYRSPRNRRERVSPADLEQFIQQHQNSETAWIAQPYQRLDFVRQRKLLSLAQQLDHETQITQRV